MKTPGKTAHLPLNPLPDLLPLPLIEQLAVTYQTDKHNQIRLPGSIVFLCLLHALLHHPKVTQRLLEDLYEQHTGRTTDHSAFSRRLATINPAYFAALYQHLYQQITPPTTATTSSSMRVRFTDATTVTLSAKLLSFGLLNKTTRPGHALRHVKTVFALPKDTQDFPQLLKLCRDKADKSDCVAIGDTLLSQTRPGDLWVFDKGCHDRNRLLALHQAQSFFITPHSQQALRRKTGVFDNGASSALESPGSGNPPEQLPTHLPGKHESLYVLTRVEQATFGNGQETAKEQARWNTLPLVVVSGYRFDQRKAAWQPLTLLTNLPLSDTGHLGPYRFEEIAQLYKQRWEIEVFFKFLKQYLCYDHLLSRSENGIEVMVYMSLIAALLLLWYQRKTRIDRGWRSVKLWFAYDVTLWVHEAIAQVFPDPHDPPPLPLPDTTRLAPRQTTGRK